MTYLNVSQQYTLCDSTLLFQIYYYRWKKRTGRIHLQQAGDVTPTEQSCLLGDNALVHGAETPQLSVTRVFLQYMAAVAFVTATGGVAYLISERVHHEDSPSAPPYMPVDWRIQAIGWTSAILYLGSRFPQILKNCKTRCEGLAPGLFFFAILGNATYALSIIVVSTEQSYLIRNASWLAGSTVTICLDLCVLCQFFYYEFVSRQRRWIDTDPSTVG